MKINLFNSRKADKPTVSKEGLIAVGMLNNEEMHTRLKADFKKYGITLIDRKYYSTNDLLDGISEHDADYVIVSDIALAGIEDGKRVFIRDVREKYQNVYIVFFMAYEQYDKEFINWAFGMGVYNINYAENGEVNIYKIIQEMLAKAMPVRVPAPEPSNEQVERISKYENLLAEKEDLIRQLQGTIKEKTAEINKLEKADNKAHKKEIELLKRQIGDLTAQLVSGGKGAQEARIDLDAEINNIRAELEAEAKKREAALRKEFEGQLQIAIEDAKHTATVEMKQQFETERDRYEQTINELKTMKEKEAAHKRNGVYRIGVFSLSRGLGSTYQSVDLAEELGVKGLSVAVISFDDSLDLTYFQGKSGRTAYIAPKKGERSRKMFELMGYQVIVIDFGNLFKLSNEGQLMGELTSIKDSIYEYMNCDIAIGIGAAEPWHIEKLQFFIKNKEIALKEQYFIVGNYNDLRNKRAYKSLVVFDRDDPGKYGPVFDRLGLY